MSGGFSADWLSLRASADDRARSTRLMQLSRDIAAAAIAETGRVRVTDMGAGTGATLRALAPHLPRPQAWVLVDADPALLREASRRYSVEPLMDVSIATSQLDLSKEQCPWSQRPDLLTASALFDLTSAAFIDGIADTCAAAAVPLLSMLTFNGQLEAEPAHQLDDEMADAFNQHQRGNKTFGPAEGPDAVKTLRHAFAARGFTEQREDTPWILHAPEDGALIRATIEGWAKAAIEHQGSSIAIEAWRAARLENTQKLTVGHVDQLFTPPKA